MFGWRARNGVIVSPPNTVVGNVFRIGHRRHRANGGLSGITEHRHRSCGRPVSQRDQLKDSKRGTIDRIGLGHACFLGYSSVDVGGFKQAWNIWENRLWKPLGPDLTWLAHRAS